MKPRSGTVPWMAIDNTQALTAAPITCGDLVGMSPTSTILGSKNLGSRVLGVLYRREDRVSSHELAPHLLRRAWKLKHDMVFTWRDDNN